MTERCPGCPYPNSPIVEGENLDRPRLVVGMAPGYEEACQKRPFIGPSGQIIRGLIGDRDDVGYTNAVQCYPGEVKDAAQKKQFEEARKLCSHRLLASLEGKDVLALGGDAAHSLLGRPVQITRSRGKQVVAEEARAPVLRALLSLHPVYVLRSGGLASTPGGLLARDVAEWLRPAELTKVRIEIDPKTVELPPKGTPVVVDIETTGLDPRTPGPQIRCYGFSWFSSEVPYSVVFSRANRWVRALLSGRYLLVAQNYPFEMKWLSIHGPGKPCFRQLDSGSYLRDQHAVPAHWHDTMLLGHTAHEDRGPGRYNLDSLAADYLPAGFPTKQELLGEYDVLSAPLDVLMPYCAWDTIKELLLFQRFTKEVYGESLLRVQEPRGRRACAQRASVDDSRSDSSSGGVPPVSGSRRESSAGARLGALRYENVALPAALFLDAIRDRGLLVSRDAIDRELKRIDDGVLAAKKYLERVARKAGLPGTNWNSDVQVRKVLGALKAKPSGVRTETGEHSLNEFSRAGIRALNPKLGKIIDAYGELKGLLHESSDFRGPKGLLATIASDGRLHPYLNQTGTRTFRLSASNPPIHGFDAGRQRCIVAAPGHVLIEADYDGAEVAWAAFLSNDPYLLDVVRSGESLHTKVAASLGIERSAAKAINFALQYGGGTPAVYRKLQEQAWGKFKIEQVDMLIRKRRGLTARYEEWAVERYIEARRTGGVLSVFGAFMRIPGATSFGETLAEAKRLAANSPIQEPASTATLVRAMEMHRAGIEVWLLRHDSILVHTKTPKKTMKLMKSIMENPRFYWGEMPWLRVSFKAGKSWGEMEKVG